MGFDNSAEWLMFLNNNTSAIQALCSAINVVVTAVLVLFTIVYVSLTRRITKTSETQLIHMKSSEISRQKQDIIISSLQLLYRYKDKLDKIRAFAVTAKEIGSDDGESDRLTEEFITDEAFKMMESGLFSELMIVSFQLKRLKGVSLWKDFEELREIFTKMFYRVRADKDPDKYEDLNTLFVNGFRAYVDKCLNEIGV